MVNGDKKQHTHIQIQETPSGQMDGWIRFLFPAYFSPLQSKWQESVMARAVRFECDILE